MTFVMGNSRRNSLEDLRALGHAGHMTTTDPVREPGPWADSGSPPAVWLQDLSKSFGHVQAVVHVDLTIEQGEVVAFLGPNGAGKTSTIDMILGLSTPSGGEVSVLGMTPQQAIRRGLVSAVMQTGGLLKDLTVGETAQYTASLFARRADVPAALKRAGIAEIADRRVDKCSGGEQQRLRFAMALLSDPELLILDEPTTGMDVEGRREFWSSIRHDADRGRTVLFATHYLEEADAYADRIVLIRKGEIVADGTSAQVKSLASGRTVRATLTGVTEEMLRTVPGADSIEVRGETVLIHSGDADKVARYLLTETSAHDLEITSRGLEEAFLALTGDDNDTTGGNR
jgi:ABC-2 type transport system ATP-binding protein